MSVNSVKKDLKIKAPDLEIIEHNTSTASVDEAALAHSVKPGQIVKTIALMLDKPILLMVAGDTKIDNKKYKNTFKKRLKCSLVSKLRNLHPTPLEVFVHLDSQKNWIYMPIYH